MAVPLTVLQLSLQGGGGGWTYLSDGISLIIYLIIILVYLIHQVLELKQQKIK
jgi:hypothetical protein